MTWQPPEPNSEDLRDRWIVMLHDGHVAGDMAAELHFSGDARIVTLYHALNGFAAYLDPATIDVVRDDPRVRLMEADVLAGPGATQSTVAVDDLDLAHTWGLDRIDQRRWRPDFAYDYLSDGDGVPVYVLDSPVRSIHEDFKTGGVTRLTGVSFRAGVGWDDANTLACTEHGQFAVGIICGNFTGVAKKAAVKVMAVADRNNVSSATSITDATNWILANHTQGAPGVVSMSHIWIDGYSVGDDLATSLYNHGLLVVAAAGNDANSTPSSPGRTATALAVSGSTRGDEWSTSKFGTWIDIIAPAQNVFAPRNWQDVYYNFGTGTSYAAPYVAGVAALVWSAYPTWTNAQVRQFILDNSTRGVISNVPADTTDRFLCSRLDWVLPVDTLNAGSSLVDTVEHGKAYRYRVRKNVAGSEFSEWVTVKTEGIEP